MSGETSLAVLLSELSPRLQPTPYVFCCIQGAKYGDLAHTEPIASMAEAEGLTVVLSQDAADREGLGYTGLFRCILLEVHSSLHAVGLTAVVAQTLATASISANVIAGYHHDHVFVPADRADDALELLTKLVLGETSR